MSLSPEQPIFAGVPEMAWGSDAIAHTLRVLGVEYISLNPGASYRGLHDSLVNYLGNERPQLLLCLHEEHAVSIAHGYAKVTERPMAVALHSNVGLMHATMSIFNAFCDRVPMLLIGATGPVDASRRRPWIDWLHTAADQAALVRDYVKWDDQPGSVNAAVESLARGFMITRTPPHAPVYLCFDSALQEHRLDADVRIPDIARHGATSHPHLDPRVAADLATLLATSQRPVVLAGRVSRSEHAWVDRVEFAERIGALVFTHLKLGAAFPTSHPLHGAPPTTFPSKALRSAIREADVIVSLDWLDLGGTLAHAGRDGEIGARVVSVSLDQHLHRGWSKDHMSPAPADIRVLSTPDAFVTQLLTSLRDVPTPSPQVAFVPCQVEPPPSRRGTGPLGLGDIATALNLAVGGKLVSLIRLPNGWPSDLWHFNSPLDFLGADGGEGVGSGIGLAIGSALALHGSDRLPVAILGDGDFLMGVNGLWTAARYRIPMLVVIANNRSFFNDEIHQQHVAKARGRPVENRWIGQRIDGPAVDLCAHARAQGLSAHGPIEEYEQLVTALAVAVAEVRDGAAVVVDVRVDPTTYATEPPGFSGEPTRDVS
jgi:thiamine pyrophosphate-dependent acetolactate synthase large subunit-like protein